MRSCRAMLSMQWRTPRIRFGRPVQMYKIRFECKSALTRIIDDAAFLERMDLRMAHAETLQELDCVRAQFRRRSARRLARISQASDSDVVVLPGIIITSSMGVGLTGQGSTHDFTIYRTVAGGRNG